MKLTKPAGNKRALEQTRSLTLGYEASGQFSLIEQPLIKIATLMLRYWAKRNGWSIFYLYDFKPL